MPRGKYPRQSAAVKAAIQKVAPVIQPPASAVVQTVIAESPPEEGFDDSEGGTPDIVAAPPVAEVAPVANPNARRPHRFADHAKSRDIDSLSLEQLREYGREIGMSGRDCRDLSEDRLRAGCRAHLSRHFDELTE